MSVTPRPTWRDWLLLGLAGIAAAYLVYALLPWLWWLLGWRYVAW